LAGSPDYCRTLESSRQIEPGRTRRPSRRTAGTSRLVAIRPQPLSASILGRPAPTHFHRPRTGRTARVPGVRRTHISLGCLRAGTGAEPDEATATRAIPDLPVYFS